MRRMFVIAIVVTGLASVSAAETTVNVHDTVATLDQQRRAALVAADRDALKKLIVTHATYTHSNGVLQTRTELLRALREGTLDYQKIVVDYENAVSRGNTVVITGVQKMDLLVNGKPLKSHSAFTAVWCHADDEKGWQMIAYQSTPVARTE